MFLQIIGKKYITLNPVKGFVENDVQGGTHEILSNQQIYIYDEKIVERSAAEYKPHLNNIFGNVPQEIIKRRNRRIKKNIERGCDNVSIGTYEISNNQVFMKWNGFYKMDIEWIFKGQILLKGDAIRGTFYENGTISIPERVYYNIDKPLPNPLLPDEIN